MKISTRQIILKKEEEKSLIDEFVKNGKIIKLTKKLQIFYKNENENENSN